MSSNQSNNTKRLLPLSPISHLDDSNPHFRSYKESLSEAFAQSEMKNIALSGNFGAGKSSILHSFDKHKNKGKEKYLYISLADFELADATATEKNTPQPSQDVQTREENSSSDQKPEKTPSQTDHQKEKKSSNSEKKNNPKQETQKRVEYSLLCQILTRCRRHHLRDSDLHAFPEASMRIIPSCLMALFACLIFVLVFPQRFTMFAEYFTGIPQDIRSKIHVCLYLTAMGGVGVLAFLLSRRLRLQKLSLASPYVNAEMALDQENTSLDLYKFELVYALERISGRIGYTVVFEDMDRLDPQICAAVMTKLRDINGMVNTRHSELHPFSKEHIRFIYALGENVLDHTQRTKFFDCIIPVVPALNRYNAEIIVCDMLHDHGVETNNHQIWGILERFLPFLNDYRTVITFCNEFQIMCKLFLENNHVLRSAANDCSILALCFYKVMAPKHYALLFHEQRDGTLPKVTPDDLKNEYGNEAYRIKLANELNTLPISFWTLETLYLEQYYDVLVNGTEDIRIDLSQKLKTDTSVDMSDHIVQKRIIENEPNPVIAAHLTSHICRNLDYEVYIEWFFQPCQNKEHKFTNCMTYMARNLDTLHNHVNLPDMDKHKLFSWCIDNLDTLRHDPSHYEHWKPRMIELLKLILAVHPYDVPPTILEIQLDSSQTVNALMPDVWKIAFRNENDKNAPSYFSAQEFTDWFIRTLSVDEDTQRQDIVENMNRFGNRNLDMSYELIQTRLIEQEPIPDIAARMIWHLQQKLKRNDFIGWFFTLSSSYKFSGCISFFSIYPESRTIMQALPGESLHTWIMDGLRLLEAAPDHQDFWDDIMCKTLGQILRYYNAGIIPDDLLPILLTYDTSVEDVLGVDLDNTVEESMDAVL